MVQTLKILHLTPSIGPRSYGLGQVALNLVKAQLEQNHEPVIWSLDSEDVRQQSLTAMGLPKESIRSFTRIGPELLGWAPSMMSAAKDEGGLFDVVHQHGIWTAQSRVTSLLRNRHGLPTVVAPHGSLEPKVLPKSRFKKALALRWYERTNLRNASSMHATAPTEVADLVAFGLDNPIALITNGISQTWIESTGDGARFRANFNLPCKPRILLYMSRIAPKKGLPMLLHAWSKLFRTHPEWMLVIVGGDEDGHKREVESLSRQLGLEDQVRFIEPISGQDKRDAFAATELFVLPSHSEGFPMVVLDALGAGVPAIVTRASSWEELETYKCGWWVKATDDAISEALGQALGRTPESLSAMGTAGKHLVASKYRWGSLAERTLELYEWISHHGPRPCFVSLPTGEMP